LFTFAHDFTRERVERAISPPLVPLLEVREPCLCCGTRLGIHWQSQGLQSICADVTLGKRFKRMGRKQGTKQEVAAPASSLTSLQSMFFCLFSVPLCQGIRLPETEGSSSLEQSLPYTV